MSLRDRFNEALKAAMKARDQKRVSTLRLVLAAVKECDIAKRSEDTREAATEEEVLSLLAKMVKQREESAQIYEAGARPELAAGEREEIAIIREFQPRQLNEEEMRKAVSAAISGIGAATPKEMGKVMAALKTRYAGSMDFAKASAIAKELLTPK